jgi:hemerythrin-like domain-containing protein
MQKVLPVAPLMIEHRLIEKMIKIMGRELQRIEKETFVDVIHINLFLDFLLTYADRCHHGKEEDILFRELKKKRLAEDHGKIMDELIAEHGIGRGLVKKISQANIRYIGGDKKAQPEIVACLKALVELYPKHIEKEDRHFFLPAMKYFSEEERARMLEEEYEFDQKLIHEKYHNLVMRLEEDFK